MNIDYLYVILNNININIDMEVLENISKVKSSLGWPETTTGHYRQRGSKHQFCGPQWPEFYLVRTTTIIKFSAVSFVEKRENIVGSDMSSCR